MNGVYASLRRRCRGDAWLQALCGLAEEKFRTQRHGDFPAWKAALRALPEVEHRAGLTRSAPRLGKAAPNPDALRETLMRLHPWRKGPLCLGGITIDTEWRSDRKWNRVVAHVSLDESRVLDIGCGNGYFGLRMLGAGARLVVGIDPAWLFVMQWLACRHFSGDIPNYVLPLGLEDLPAGGAEFDAVFSMGVIYHRRNPLGHLQRIRELLRGRGQLVLESLVLAGTGETDLLVPEDRYARMRNVRVIPGSQRLLEWIEAAGFGAVRLVDLSPTTIAEQRRTAWMRFESLAQALDPDDPTRTVEGHPAPVRAVIVARG